MEDNPYNYVIMNRTRGTKEFYCMSEVQAVSTMLMWESTMEQAEKDFASVLPVTTTTPTLTTVN